MFKRWALLTARLGQLLITVATYVAILLITLFGTLVLLVLAVPLVAAFIGLVISLTPLGPMVVYGASKLGLVITPSDLPALFAFISLIGALFNAKVNSGNSKN